MGLEVITEGAVFDVVVLSDYVIKIPKKEQIDPYPLTEERLAFIVEGQNFLSEHLPWVLPCRRIGDVVIMPKAPGIRADKIKDKFFLEALRNKCGDEIRDLGYQLKDLSWKNIFFDSETGLLYFVDFHRLVKLE